jgi:3-deoxy-7-phosphoheptulonate synthase
MIIAIKPGTSKEDIHNFTARLEKQGGTVHYSQGASQTVLGLVGDTTGIDVEALSAHRLVEKLIRVQEPYKRANQMFHPGTPVSTFPYRAGICEASAGAVGHHR